MKNNNKKSKTSRRIIIAFLIMLAIVLTTGTYAYWATSVEGTSNEALGTLTIGSADGVETKFILSNELNSGGTLVPVGQTKNSNQIDAVESIDLLYNVKWAESSDYTQLEGTSSIGDVKISYNINIENNGEILDHEDYMNVYSLIHVIYGNENPNQLILDAEAKTYSFTVTMEEPSNQVEYNLIKDSEISIVFTFLIIDNNITTSTENVITEPYIDLLGDDIVYIEISNTYVDEGYIAYDSLGNIITNTWMWGSVDTWKLGKYTVYYQGYSATDESYIELTTRTVIVVDTTSPVITINNDGVYNLKLGYDYIDAGAYAIDNSTEEISVKVSGLDKLDVNTAGTYLVTYYAQDSSGNESTATRTIIVE
ncbi:MAG: DUF5011 domain-containing protein [Tenericutes bacterium]|nr:DUF5011 domain-containing protein [Mycoplasmatota bacterium]